MDCQARFLAAAHAFLRERSIGAMAALLTAYALHHVAVYGSDNNLDYELERIERHARQILSGLP